MAYDRKALKLSFIGHDISTDEVFVTSVHVSGLSTSYDPLDDIASYDDTACEGLLTAYATMMAVNALQYSDYGSVTHLKVAPIGTDGKYLDSPFIHARSGAAITGGVTTIHPQLSIVLSLWSGDTLGKGNYGRMYLPYTSQALDTNASYSTSSSQTNVANGAATFLGAINTLATGISTGTGLRIMSNATVSKPVAYVRVGRVTDTQRRRRNAISENLSAGTVAL